ncbi:nitrate reductase molybdenum cofactor assembly chaperone [Spectribacter hydrogenoxidans]|uniref:Nitrate reductase molybdenum cofactor assembly chaperone n=1 Tax=Spectribacter hydrogenoxidans TaxID=3075608 RepID=A0ABU3BYD3_9GAMM|nr:nitrate reductase molybdenum cofactor assembly chaperone [Salinisphaera sp. W335]MDT0634319.1 nitrate reductase molybdenum cofactor assembly chaperone [Salinisphaera sp. W335]
MTGVANDLGPPLKAVSALLSYPDAELQAHIHEVAAVLEPCTELTAEDRRILDVFADWIADTELLEVQAAYVETFDRSKKVSLYLFEHVYGESRDRGPAMIELANAYRECGLEIDARELPDFLPMFLEFLTELDEPAAREWLAEVGHILQQVHVRLIERESHFAAPLRALLCLARLEPVPEALTQMVSEEVRDDTPAMLDRTWEEAPVTFGPDQPAMSCGATKQEPAEQRVQWMDFRDRTGSDRG